MVCGMWKGREGREEEMVSVHCCCVVGLGAEVVFSGVVCCYVVQVTGVDYATVSHCGVRVVVSGLFVL